MATVQIYGGHPLKGKVTVAGARNSASKLIYASLFSDADVTLDNVPRTKSLEEDIEVLTTIGVGCDWVGRNKLRINAAKANSFEVPHSVGAKNRLSLLLVPGLIYRFGKAIVPMPSETKYTRPVNRILDTWKSFGYDVVTDGDYYIISCPKPTAATISFKINTHTGTDNAILTALFAEGTSLINNAAEEAEISDLIAFCNLLGGNVERIDPRTIRVTGVTTFTTKDCYFRVQDDIQEAVIFILAGLLTKGNITVEHIDRKHLVGLVNVLTKIGCRYEFENTSIKVWYAGDTYLPVNVTATPAPGFLTDWLTYLAVLLSQVAGVSTLHDTVYVDRISSLADELTNFGAVAHALTPSEAGLDVIVSDDLYRSSQEVSEPKTVLKVTGPSELQPQRLPMNDLRFGPLRILLALAANGTSIISGFDQIERNFDSFMEKLSALDAKMELI